MDFTLPAGKAWQDLTIEVPVEGRAGIVRLYLPADQSPVEIQTFQFRDRRGTKKDWDFGGTKR